MKINSIIRLPPKVIVSAAKRRMFLFKERHFRFRGFSNYPQGVNLVSYNRAEMGLGVLGRGLASAFDAAQIPFNILNFEHGNLARHGDLTWQHKEVISSNYDVTVLAVNPDNIFNARFLLPNEIFQNRYVIGHWVWELPEIPYDWIQAFSLVNEVWVASRFIQEATSRKCNLPVVYVPPVISARRNTRFGRNYFGLPENAFLFLSICDTGSILERKNPLGAVAAFKKAFATNDESVGLVLKISGPRNMQINWDLIKDELEGYANIWLIDRILTVDEIASLQTLTDCFVSLHRSEGFGLCPAEFMSLGKPAILTRWSGNTDYMTSENSIGIDYQLVKLEQDYGPYEAGNTWAEPDLDQAAYWMKRLASEPELAQRIGSLGQKTISEDFSANRVGEIVRSRLTQIRE